LLEKAISHKILPCNFKNLFPGYFDEKTLRYHSQQPIGTDIKVSPEKKKILQIYIICTHKKKLPYLGSRQEREARKKRFDKFMRAIK
jgi:hypothetical protein